MDNIVIWCYSCGAMWFDRKLIDLYSALARCPNCNGYTDGVK